jgi:hypothetical protein
MLAGVPGPEIVVFVLGAAVVGRTALSAVRAFLLPRASHDRIARFVFRGTRRLFNLFAGPSVPYARRDRYLAYKGPVSLVLLPGTWLLLIAIGYAAMYWAVGVGTPWDAVATSGSTLLTLGFIRPAGHVAELLSFTEAIVGPTLLALLISYLPTIYSAFSRRELLVGMLEVEAGSPPSPVALLMRVDQPEGLSALSDLWADWERWFVELSETHTSLTVLVDYRSQKAERSWVNAAGAILDTAAIVRSALAVPPDRRTDRLLRAGTLALRQIADAFSLPYDPAPAPDAPTSVDQAHFEAALAVLADGGVPLRSDRDGIWCDFIAWRVRYDVPLRALERLTSAPQTWWEQPQTA